MFASWRFSLRWRARTVQRGETNVEHLVPEKPISEFLGFSADC